MKKNKDIDKEQDLNFNTISLFNKNRFNEINNVIKFLEILKKYFYLDLFKFFIFINQIYRTKTAEKIRLILK